MEGSPSDPTQRLSQELQNTTEKFGQEVRCLYRAFSADFPKELSGTAYHYTTEAGIYGILKSGTLWLTDIFALNDPSELRHGIDLAIRAFDSIGIDDLPECEFYKEAVSSVLPDHAMRKIVEPYSCSFSINGDDLGQWRGYADDGQGYSIGFDLKLLDNGFSTNDIRRAVFSVAYEDKTLIEVFEKTVKLIKSVCHFDLVTPGEMEEYCKRIVKEFVRWAVMFSLHYKHHAYSNEAEYRFLELPAPSSNPIHKLRPRAQELIKYRELDWKAAGSGVLARIIIGPAANYERSKRFAKECLREAGIHLSDDAITQSQIPYKPA